MLKAMMIGAALASAIGAPAMAQSYNPAMGTGNVTPNPNSAPYAYNSSAYRSYAYVPEAYGAYAYSPYGYAGPFAYEVPAPRHYYRHRWHRY